jgi:hypothetical protein
VVIPLSAFRSLDSMSVHLPTTFPKLTSVRRPDYTLHYDFRFSNPSFSLGSVNGLLLFSVCSSIRVHSLISFILLALCMACFSSPSFSRWKSRLLTGDASLKKSVCTGWVSS